MAKTNSIPQRRLVELFKPKICPKSVKSATASAVERFRLGLKAASKYSPFPPEAPPIRLYLSIFNKNKFIQRNCA